MTSRIIATTRDLVAELKADIAEATAEITNWAATVQAAIKEEQNTHKENIQEKTADIEALQAKSENNKAAASAQKAVAEEQSRRIAKAENQLAVLADAENRVDAQQQRLMDQKGALLEEKALLLRDIEGRKQHLEHMRAGDLDANIHVFKTRLGWEISRVSEKVVKMTFTHVDPSRVARPCSFLLLDENRQFEEPALDPDACDEVVAQFNQTRNIAQFVVGMRALFKAAVTM